MQWLYIYAIVLASSNYLTSQLIFGKSQFDVKISQESDYFEMKNVKTVIEFKAASPSSLDKKSETFI